MAYEDTHDWKDNVRTKQGGAGMGEHTLAWVMALGAIAYAVVGLLVGFGILGSESSVAGTSVGDAVNEAGGTIQTAAADWQEGLLWMLPAISSAFLAMTLHQTDHHFTRGPRADENKGMFGFEHAVAYLMALGAIATGILGLLVGFDVFDRGNGVGDGYLWQTASIGMSILAATTHAVRHHQLVEDEDYIVSVVDRRVGTGYTTTEGGRMTDPSLERRP